MKLRPEGAKVLIEVDKIDLGESKYIFIPETVKDKHQYTMSMGTVISAGPGATCEFYIKDSEKPDEKGTTTRYLKPGDKVWFCKYGGAPFEYLPAEDKKSGKEWRIINDEDVMALVDDE